jgi:phage FluMu protein Com
MTNRRIVRCPLCNKRVLDIEGDYVVLYIKCPHCRTEHKIVVTPKKVA